MYKVKLLLPLFFLSVSTACFPKYSSFKPDTPWLDNNGVHINAHGGGILDYDGVYYWFGEHKVKGRIGNTAQVGVHCYSSTDLYNWKDEGIALAVRTSADIEIVKGCVIERPKVIYNKKTDKFVMWFHLELKGQGYRAARTGVALSNSVTGPYQYLRSYRPNAGDIPLKESLTGDLKYYNRDFKDGQMSRDMTLFIDDDGTAYHIHASEENQTLHISQLSDDYLSFSGVYTRAFQGAANEAPAMFKHDGVYYMITSGCTGWKPNTARSGMARHILGPWVELGNPCEGLNPHNNLGAEKTFGGQSTFILPVRGKEGAFIAMFDVWTPKNPIDGRYIWLPVSFQENRFIMKWYKEWDLSLFK